MPPGIINYKLIKSTVMKTTKQLCALLLLASFMLAFGGCNKYEDGPVFSIRPKKERVAAEWEVKSFTINGESALNQTYSDNFICIDGDIVFYEESFTMSRFIWTFEKNGDWNIEASYANSVLDYETSYDLCSDFYVFSEENESDSGGWSFVSDKEEIELTFDNGGSPETWEIKELREKQMKLERIEDSDRIEITLVKR